MGSGPEMKTSFKNSLRTALSRLLKVRPKTRELLLHMISKPRKEQEQPPRRDC